MNKHIRTGLMAVVIAATGLSTGWAANANRISTIPCEQDILGVGVLRDSAGEHLVIPTGLHVYTSDYVPLTKTWTPGPVLAPPPGVAAGDVHAVDGTPNVVGAYPAANPTEYRYYKLAGAQWQPAGAAPMPAPFGQWANVAAASSLGLVIQEFDNAGAVRYALLRMNQPAVILLTTTPGQNSGATFAGSRILIGTQTHSPGVEMELAAHVFDATGTPLASATNQLAYDPWALWISVLSSGVWYADGGTLHTVGVPGFFQARTLASGLAQAGTIRDDITGSIHVGGADAEGIVRYVKFDASDRRLFNRSTIAHLNIVSPDGACAAGDSNPVELLNGENGLTQTRNLFELNEEPAAAFRFWRTADGATHLIKGSHWADVVRICRVDNVGPWQKYTGEILRPRHIDFGQVPVGQTATRTLTAQGFVVPTPGTIMNDSFTMEPEASPFAFAPRQITINPDAPANVTISFKPTAKGPFNTIVHVEYRTSSSGFGFEDNAFDAIRVRGTGK